MTDAGLSRRRFLAGALGAGGLGALVACGNQVGQLQGAPYATNVARNPVNAPAPALNGGILTQSQPLATAVAAAPSMTAIPGMSNMTSTQSVQAAGPHTTYDAALPALLPLVPGTSNVRTLNMTTSETTLQIADGVSFAAWTFGGTVPGPVAHVKQGDTVKFTLTNKGTMPHSIDFHAAQVPPNLRYIDVKPGESLSYDWTADSPGVFMYHCGSPLVIAHLASGMYGAVVVDPPTSLPAREYVLVQNEFYTMGKEGDVQQVDINKALNGQPDYVVFNGYANQYKDNPLTATAGELMRFHIVNAGPNVFSAFHVIGTIFQSTYPDGNPANIQHGNQTVTIPPGGGSMVEFTIPNPGMYPFVTHSFSGVNKGAIGVLNVTQ